MLANGYPPLIIGLTIGTEIERGESNERPRGGNGGALVDFGGEPSKLIRGALSCGSRLAV